MPKARKHLLSPAKYGGHYHCISRVVDRNFVFGTHERDIFRKILRQVEAFSGVRVVTWTILSNHFHVLLHIVPPPVDPLTEADILDRCRALYSPASMRFIEDEFEGAQRQGADSLAGFRAKYLKRMWNLSEFMKTLKQKFTSWFNRKRERSGTLWEARFKSVLVEGSYRCLLKVAAYIDLNAVRAGLVADPKDYRWCGYSEALAGDRRARRGLASALEDMKAGATWRDLAPRYRTLLFGIGENRGSGESEARGLSRADVAKVIAAGGKLSPAQLLRCRIRYFSDGLAIGSESFVESFFQSRRVLFSKRRETGARRLKGGEWGNMRSARDLSVEPVTLSGVD